MNDNRETILLVLRKKEAARKTILKYTEQDPEMTSHVPAVKQAFQLADEITASINKVTVAHPLLQDVFEVLVPLIIGITEGKPSDVVKEFFDFKAKEKTVMSAKVLTSPEDMLKSLQALQEKKTSIIQ